MLRSYFKIAIRNLLRNKMLSVINILGLGVGIACCVLITLFVLNETSYDRFHRNAGRIVRVTMEYAADGIPNKVSVTGNKVFPAFKKDFPEVENGVRTLPAQAIVQLGQKIYDEKKFLYADSTLFDIFSFGLLQGDPKKVLSEPNEVVLTVSAARKYFGNENPVGKSLRIDNEKNYKVTGVAEDCPPNSQIKFDMVASFTSLEPYRYREETWWDASYYTYLLLRTPEAIGPLQAKIPGYIKKQESGNTGNHPGNYLTFNLEPLNKVHLYSTVEGGIEPAGDYRYVYIFSLIALLIIAVACANYVNLTTARATERAKEVGIRKVMGALRLQLFGQFMGESIILVTLSCLTGLILVKFLLPTFNLLAAKQLEFKAIFQQGAIAVSAIVLCVVGMLGGSYPALLLSKFSAIKVLKGNLKAGVSGVWLRKSLIVVQFIISAGLILATMIIHSQLNFIQNKKLGYNKENIIVLPTDKFIREKLASFKSELLTNPEIRSITTTNQTPIFVPGKYDLSLNSREMIVTAVRTDKDFIKTLQLKILSGADFTDADQKLVDSTDIRRPLIINETAAKSLGWTPNEAVGKSLQFQGIRGIVKGVVNDFHFSSMHEEITAFVIFLSSNTHNMLVKISGDHTAQTLQYIGQMWKSLAPYRPFEYEFLDDQFDKLYNVETRTGKLFYSFAILAIGLACLGLFGLVAFIAQQRTKEIGIRKVLGATVLNIAALLSREFIFLVVIAILVASPLAWWAMNKWLQSFAYHIVLNGWMFVGSGLIPILIALATLSFQAIKTALASPVKSLRTE
ncbi:MAG TPA: ABC transporter permease [Puia sp.]|nr:ABC transporter permease [Puia sp.]